MGHQKNRFKAENEVKCVHKILPKPGLCGMGLWGGGAVSGISMNLMIANDGRVKVESYCSRAGKTAQ